MIALFTFGFELLARGAFAGAGEFGAYGVSMGAEGIIRLLPCIVLVAVGSTDPVGFGLCLAIPPALATLVALRGQHRLMTPGPERAVVGALDQPRAAARRLAARAGARATRRSSAPSCSPRRASGVMVADFIVGLFLSRIPILLFQAVQAALLPRLAAQVSAGQTDDFRRGMRNLLLVVSGIGVVGVVGGATLGPFVGHLLFGAKFELGNLDLALLAAGSGMFIFALTHVAGVDRARTRSGQVLVSWLVGVVAFIVATLVSSTDLFTRVEIGSIVGAGAARARRWA